MGTNRYIKEFDLIIIIARDKHEDLGGTNVFVDIKL